MKLIKAALVTGASRGIGAQIAINLAEKGYAIGINYSKQEEKAFNVAKKIESLGGQAILLQGDVANKNDVNQIVNKLVDKWGNINVLVNNAGISRDVRLVNMTEEEWDSVIGTNLKGTFLCSQIVGQIMSKQQAGSIINIASIVGITGRIGQANYAASKAEIIALTKGFAVELAPDKVRVNVIVPAFIGSDMTKNLSPEALENVLRTIPMGRMGSSEDLAKMVCFLADQDMEYVSGQVFHVDCRIVQS